MTDRQVVEVAGDFLNTRISNKRTKRLRRQRGQVNYQDARFPLHTLTAKKKSQHQQQRQSQSTAKRLEGTRSHSISEAKQGQAWLALGWETKEIQTSNKGESLPNRVE